MSEKDEAYKYTVPLEDSDDGKAPVSQPTYNGDVYLSVYKGNYLVVVQTEPSPHMHKDNSEVKVERVDPEEYN
jgi:hypothetical protein